MTKKIAVSLLPQSPTYLENRAAAYKSTGNYAAALFACIAATYLDSQNFKILFCLSFIYTSLGQLEEAIMTFGRIHPPPSAKDTAPAKEMLQHVRAARAALRDGTAGSMVLHALDMAERQLGIGALRPRAWQLMHGEAYLKMGTINNLGEAANVAMSLLRLNDKDPEAIVLRGRVLYAQGNNAEALKYFRRAIGLNPDNKDAVKWLRVVLKLDRMKKKNNNNNKTKHKKNTNQKNTKTQEIDPT